MKKLLLIFMLFTIPLLAQSKSLGDVSYFTKNLWKLDGTVVSPASTAWTLTLPATTFSPSIVTPLIIGGADTISTLTYKTTTGVGKTGARHIFQVGNNGATEAMTILNSGNVGIGTTAPTSKLEINDVGKTVLDLYRYSNFAINTTDAFAIDKGGTLSLGGKYSTASIIYGFGAVKGAKEDATDGIIHGYLSFMTTRAGIGSVERMRITSTGNVGIGTTTPYAQLSQVGATPIWYATDSDFNLHRTSLAFATDTAAIKIDASVTQPIITFKNTIGNGFTLQSVAAGGASFDGGLTIAGAFTGNAVTRGTNAFTTDAVSDTVTISGAEIGDYYSITLTGTAAPLAADAIRLQKTATGFVLWRSASGTSGLTYDWLSQR